MRGKKPEKNSQAVVTMSKRPALLPQKSRSAMFVVVAIVVIAAIGVAIKIIKPKAAVANNICLVAPNTQLLQDAAVNFDANKRYELQKDAAAIQKLANYQQDPNCLYVLTRYYINSNDTANARKYVNQLAKVYNAKQGLSLYVGNRPLSVSELQSQVSFLEKNAAQAKNNAHAFGNP